MQTYLVGGAVRDKLLGRPIKDQDWVVVGASPKQMLAQGFQAVGSDFLLATEGAASGSGWCSGGLD